MAPEDKVIHIPSQNGQYDRLYWKCAFCKGIHSIPMGPETGWHWNESKSSPKVIGHCIVLPCGNNDHLYGKDLLYYCLPQSAWTEEEIQSTLNTVQVKGLTIIRKRNKLKGLRSFSLDYSPDS